MPFYQYTATDAQGNRTEGMLQGGTWKDVDRELFQRGLTLTGIVEVREPEVLTTSQAPAPRSSSTPPLSAAQPSRGLQNIASPTAQQARPTAPPTALPHSGRARDKDRILFFQQLEALLRSGIAPASAFQHLASARVKRVFDPAIQECVVAATNGQSIADVFARFPKLFPPHVVGIYRVGELGGFPADACHEISEQAIHAHRFGGAIRWTHWLFWPSLATVPMAFVASRGMLAAWDRVDAAGGQGDAMGMVMQGFAVEFARIGIPTAIGAVLVFVLVRLWLADFNRVRRHAFNLRVPIFGVRERSESLGLFMWAMSSLFRIGLPPKAALTAAADAVPNQALAAQLREHAAAMRAETKLTSVIEHVPMVDPGLKGLIQTGEFVGDLPNTLANVSRIEKQTFNERIRLCNWTLARIVGVTLVGTAGAAYIIMQKLWLEGLFQRFESWIQ